MSSNFRNVGGVCLDPVEHCVGENGQLPQPSAEHKHDETTPHTIWMPSWKLPQHLLFQNLSKGTIILQNLPSLSSNWFRTEILDPSVSHYLHIVLYILSLGFSPSTVSLMVHHIPSSNPPVKPWDNQTWFPLKDGISTGTFLDTYLESAHLFHGMCMGELLCVTIKSVGVAGLAIYFYLSV